VFSSYPVPGSQLKTSYPSKAATFSVSDEVSPPVVRLKNGDVLEVDDTELAKKLAEKDEIDAVLFAGSLLVSFGDVCEAKNVLLPPEWTEEWYVHYVRKHMDKISDAELAGVARRIVEEGYLPPPEVAFRLSRAVVDIPLHPKYTYQYAWADVDELRKLHAAVREMRDNKLPLDVKQVLEKALIPHKVVGDALLLDDRVAEVLRLTFSSSRYPDTRDPLEYVFLASGCYVMDKYPTIIGARLGRPPNVKGFKRGREMQPPVHVLFPVGIYGGPSRLVNKAAREHEKIEVELTFFICPKCMTRSPCRLCPRCGTKANPERSPSKEPINIKELFEQAKKRVGVSEDIAVKGVMGLVSDKKIAMPLEKGVLRAKHQLFGFKDGTIRCDITHLPLVAFKVKEVIGLTLERARQLGYEVDSEDEEVQLLPQDIILPINAGKLFVRIAKYTDELLEKVYGLEPYYKVSKPEDLIGHIFFAISPHTAIAVGLRLIGFTKHNVAYNHPMAIAMRRRDCDAEADSYGLALQWLLDFSEEYLRNRPGKMEDAPLLSVWGIEPLEVDTQVYGLDTAGEYPLEVYEAAMRREMASNLRDKVECIEHKLADAERALVGHRYTTSTSNLNEGAVVCRYQEEAEGGKKKSMEEKVAEEFAMIKKIGGEAYRRAVVLTIKKHIVPDYKGNLRSYSIQGFRCTKCNRKYRRMYLDGKCPSCNRALIPTVTRGNVIKYLGLMKVMSEEIGDEELKEDVKEYISEVVSAFGKGVLEEVEQKAKKYLEALEAELHPPPKTVQATLVQEGGEA